MTRGRDGLSPGDMGDPVAESIRNQQMHDARPTDEEMKEAKRKANTCDECGTHDPDSVTTRTSERYYPDCNTVQRPPEPFGELCDDCYDPETKADRIKHELGLDDVDYVVEYECGWLETVSDEYDGDHEFRPPHWQPSVEIKNPRCGHLLERVWTEADIDDMEVDQ